MINYQVNLFKYSVSWFICKKCQMYLALVKYYFHNYTSSYVSRILFSQQILYGILAWTVRNKRVEAHAEIKILNPLSTHRYSKIFHKNSF